MAVYSARQSSYSDGDTITAAHTNDEFNAILAAFNVSTGHTHDGSTAGDGGPISNLFSNALVFGTNADTDIAITFNANSNDGVLTWMEDEDYFQFSDDILLTTTEKLQFRDTAIYINSSADGQLDLVADTEIQIAATTVDINGNADISGNLGIGGNLTVTGTTTFNGGTITMGDAATDNVVFGADVDSNIIPDDDNTYDLGSSSQEWKDLYVDGVAYLDEINFNGTAITSTAAELNLLDGVSGLVQADFTKLAAVDSTAAELNIVDGDTSATSTTVADADRVVLNDNGTMVQVAVTDLAAYFDDEITTMPNLTSVGTLTTLTVDNIIVNGTTIGHTSDTDLITLANGSATIAGDLSVTGTLDVGDSNITNIGSIALDTITNDGTDITLDSSGDIILDADDGDIQFKNGGTLFGSVNSDASSPQAMRIQAHASNGDIIFKGNDDGSTITALTLDMSEAGAATFNSTVTANAGVVVDNITIDGTEINLSSGNLTVDVAGEIHLDADGAIIRFKDAGTDIGTFENVSSDFVIKSSISNQDLIFKGNDGGSAVTALTLDMSDAGKATFNSNIVVSSTVLGSSDLNLTSSDGNEKILLDASGTQRFNVDGSEGMRLTTTGLGIGTSSPSSTLHVVGDLKIDDITIDGSTISDGGTLTIDVASNLEFDAGGGLFSFKDDGSEVYRITNSSGDISLKSLTSDKDISIQGNDGGSVVSAVTFDMSDAGTATFNHDILLGDSGEIKLGDSQDLRIYHDDTHSYVQDNGSGQLRIKSNGNAITLVTGAGNDLLVNAVVGGAVELYHNTAKKIETTSSGIDVTGLVEFDSLSGTGSVAITDIADEDDMTSNSATKLSTQQSIKAYADTKAGKGFAVAMAIAL